MPPRRSQSRETAGRVHARSRLALRELQYRRRRGAAMRFLLGPSPPRAGVCKMPRAGDAALRLERGAPEALRAAVEGGQRFRGARNAAAQRLRKGRREAGGLRSQPGRGRAHRHLCAGRRVLAYEPCPDNFKLFLLRNLKRRSLQSPGGVPRCGAPGAGRRAPDAVPPHLVAPSEKPNAFFIRVWPCPGTCQG